MKTNLTRLRGWAQRGERLVVDAPFGSWGTPTFITGLSADALIAPWIIKGAMDGPAFAAYVEKVLVPELPPAQWSLWTTSPPTRTRPPPKPCVKPDAGSCSVVRGKRSTGAFSDPSTPYSPDLKGGLSVRL